MSQSGLQIDLTKNPATRNRIRDHLIAAAFYNQMLYELRLSRLVRITTATSTKITSRLTRSAPLRARATSTHVQ